MKNRANLGKGLFVASIASVCIVGALSSTAEARRPLPSDWCVCPMIYAPVLCPDGNVYTNSCFAGCEGQTGCVPSGPGPVPL